MTDLIDLALTEDLGEPYCDITTQTLFADDEQIYKVNIISKEKVPVVLCGIDLIKNILQKITTDFTVTSKYKDGAWVTPGEVIASITATASVLLMTERTILNFLRHLSAVATLTAQFVQQVAHTSLKILDTRKTLPAFRTLEKYAVTCGGGVNHREGLYDAILVKDTHVDLLGGMEKTLAKLKANNVFYGDIIIEVRDINELKIVLAQQNLKITRVLLDNMSPELMRECVSLCSNKISTEASGNITLHNIVEVAKTGVDFASVGAITHSAGNLDFSMQGLGLHLESIK